MNPEWFAGRLRELREQMGLSREQLADRAGLKVGGVRDLEQGRRQPALATLVSLCQALGVSCDVLLAKPSDDLGPVKLGRPKKPADEVQTPAPPVEAPAAKKPTKKRKGK